MSAGGGRPGCEGVPRKPLHSPTSTGIRMNVGLGTREGFRVGEYVLGQLLGRGVSGAVYHAIHSKNGSSAAIKQLDLGKLELGRQTTITMEAAILKELDHDNVMKVLDVIKTEDHLNLVMEFVENGSLTNVLRKFGTFPESLIAFYVEQILRGVDYLHTKGVLHRDIKGANILITKEGTVKLADFGVASQLSEEQKRISVVGTPYWMAPEMIQMTGQFSSSDIWSLGCVVIELLTTKPPYSNLPAMSAMFKMVQDPHPPFPEGISELLEDFLLQCFEKDPIARVSAKELLEHPWIAENRKQTSRSGVTLKEAKLTLKRYHEKGHDEKSDTIKRMPVPRQDAPKGANRPRSSEAVTIGQWYEQKLLQLFGSFGSKEELMAKIKDHVQQSRVSKAELEELQKERSQMIARLTAAEANAQTPESVDALQKKLKDAEARANEETERRKALEASADQEHGKVAFEEEERQVVLGMKDAGAKLVEAMAVIATLREELQSEKQARVMQEKFAVKEHVEECELLKKELASMEGTVNEREEQLEKQVMECSRMENELFLLREDVSKWRKVAEDWKRKCDHKDGGESVQKDQLRDRATLLERRVTALEQENVEAQKKIDALQGTAAENRVLNVECSRLRARVAELDRRLRVHQENEQRVADPGVEGDNTSQRKTSPKPPLVVRTGSNILPASPLGGNRAPSLTFSAGVSTPQSRDVPTTPGSPPQTPIPASPSSIGGETPGERRTLTKAEKAERRKTLKLEKDREKLERQNQDPSGGPCVVQ